MIYNPYELAFMNLDDPIVLNLRKLGRKKKCLSLYFKEKFNIFKKD